MAKAIQAINISTDEYQNIDVDELVHAGITDVMVEAKRTGSPLASTVLPAVLSDFEDTNINVHAVVGCFSGTDPFDSTRRTDVLTFCEGLATESLTSGDYEGLKGITLNYCGFEGDTDDATTIAGEQDTNAVNVVTDFVESIKDGIDAINDTLILSAYIGSKLGTNAYLYGQDYGKLSLHLDWEIIETYTYTESGINHESDWIGQVMRYVIPRTTGCKIIAGIRTYNEISEEPKTTATLKSEVYAAVKNHALGWCFHEYGSKFPIYPFVSTGTGSTTMSTYRPVWICSDIVYSYTLDQQQIKVITDILEAEGIEVNFYSHGFQFGSYYDFENAPADALIVIRHGGIDALQFWEMCYSEWFLNKLGFRKMCQIFMATAKRLTGLSWLEPAWDANNPSWFTGMDNPGQTLIDHGYNWFEGIGAEHTLEEAAEFIIDEARLSGGEDTTTTGTVPQVSGAGEDDYFGPSILDQEIILNNDGLVEGNKIAVSDYNGEWKLYEIKKTGVKIDDNKETLNVYAENVYYQLGDEWPFIADFDDITPEQALSVSLLGSHPNYKSNAWQKPETQWKPGICEIEAVSQNLEVRTKNTLAVLRLLAETFGGELEFKVDVNANQVVSKTVNFLNTIGSWDGKRIEFGHDIKGIEITTDYTGIKTGIMPFGKRESEDGLEQYWSISSTEWIKGVSYPIYDGGPYYPAPVDKLDGALTIEIPELKDKYGYYDKSSDEMRHRYLTWVTDDTNDEYSLPWMAWDELLKNCTPLLNIKVDGVALDGVAGFEHERLRLGDSVVCIMQDKVNSIPARVLKIERVLNEPENCKYELGNYLRTGARIVINNRLFEYPTEYDMLKRPIRGDDGELVIPDDDYTDPNASDQQTGRIPYSYYTDMVSRVTNWISTYGTTPRIVYIVSGESDSVSYATYLNMVTWVTNYQTTNQKNPLYVPTYPSSSSGTGDYTIDGYTVYKQINSYYSGPACLQSVLKYYGVFIEQTILANWAGTTTSGTSHEGIRAAMGRAGSDSGMKFTWFSDIFTGWTDLNTDYISKDVPVIVHVKTGPLINYAGNYDQYMVIIGLNSDNVLVADPTFTAYHWYDKDEFEDAMTAKGTIGSYPHLMGFTSGSSSGPNLLKFYNATGVSLYTAQDLWDWMASESAWVLYYNPQRTPASLLADWVGDGEMNGNCCDLTRFCRPLLLELGYSFEYRYGTVNCADTGSVGHVWSAIWGKEYGNTKTVFDPTGAGYGKDIGVVCCSTVGTYTVDPEFMVDASMNL